MNVDALTVQIVVAAIIVLALFAFFLRRVSREQGSVEKLSSEIDAMQREQRLNEAAALRDLNKNGKP